MFEVISVGGLIVFGVEVSVSKYTQSDEMVTRFNRL